MPVRQGTVDPPRIYVGPTPVARIYLGATLVWQAVAPSGFGTSSFGTAPFGGSGAAAAAPVAAPGP